MSDQGRAARRVTERHLGNNSQTVLQGAERLLRMAQEIERLRAINRRLTAALDEASRGVHKSEHRDVLREARGHTD